MIKGAPRRGANLDTTSHLPVPNSEGRQRVSFVRSICGQFIIAQRRRTERFAAHERGGTYRRNETWMANLQLSR